ncbi:MAG: non-ribosomal peptide synthetase, partial [Blastocatellia bacterium]
GSFEDRLAAVREAALDSYAHQDVPFEEIVEVVQPARAHPGSSLFSVMFALQNTPAAELRLRGLTLTRIELESTSSKFELTLSLEETGPGLKGTVEYSTDLFDRATITRMIRHFQNLVGTVASNPRVKIDEIELLLPAERKLLLEDWSRTDRDYGIFGCLHELFEARVHRGPDRIAVTCEEGTVSYRELDLRADEIAHQLRRLGVGLEAVTGLFAERSIEMIAGMLGILKAGGAYLPIDPSLPPERVRFMLADAGVAVVVTEESLAGAVGGGVSIVSLPLGCYDASLDLLGGECAERPGTGVGHDNLAYVLYTSGSTGRPKGVAVTHRSICNHMLWIVEDCPLSEDDRVLQKTAFGFDASVWEFFAPLIAGAELVMASPGGHRDPAYMVRAMAEQAITIVQFIPSMLRLVLDESRFEQCGSLKAVYSGGEPLTVDLQEKFQARSRAELRNLYGPTEATIDATSWRCDRSVESAAIPIGLPISNAEVYILDDRLQPVPIGVVGELYLAGKCLSRGYVAGPDLTAAVFIPNPFGRERGDRLYRTGDLARFLPSGNVQYAGRNDHQLKIRGFRVEIGEIDAALARHPGFAGSRRHLVGETTGLFYPGRLCCSP